MYKIIKTEKAKLKESQHSREHACMPCSGKSKRGEKSRVVTEHCFRKPMEEHTHCSLVAPKKMITTFPLFRNYDRTGERQKGILQSFVGISYRVQNQEIINVYFSHFFAHFNFLCKKIHAGNKRCCTHHITPNLPHRTPAPCLNLCCVSSMLLTPWYNQSTAQCINQPQQCWHKGPVLCVGSPINYAHYSSPK